MTNEELAVLIQRGERGKLLELWAGVRRFAHDRAYKWAKALDGRGGVTVEDLEQVAFLALLDAAGSFEPGAGVFLTWYGLQLKAAFTEATGLRTQRARQDPMQRALSLDQPLTDSEGEPFTLADTLEDLAALEEMEGVERRDWVWRRHTAIEAAVQSLQGPQVLVIRARYYRGRTPREAAAELGMSVEQVRRHEARALRSLRNPQVSRGLRAYLA